MNKLIHTLGALLLVSAPAFAQEANEYGKDVELSRLAPIDPAILVSLLPDHTMTASKIKVGHVSDGRPLLCFKDPDKQLVECFVVNLKTGQVVFISLPADVTSI